MTRDQRTGGQTVYMIAVNARNKMEITTNCSRACISYDSIVRNVGIITKELLKRCVIVEDF